MRISIEQAQPEDAEKIVEILCEAAAWLEEKGVPLWNRDWITLDKIAPQVEAGMFWLAKIGGESAGCVRYQTSDEEYWDDVPHADSAFIHRLAVRRKFAGQSVSKSLIEWAREKAGREGKTYLRLDCADRASLRAVYEKQGFVFHSVKKKEPYPVVRYELSLRK